jgi:hypothetical protein
MRKGPAHIQELLHTIQGITGHLDQLRRDEGLLGEVRARLPVSTRPHCLQAATKDGILTLTLDSSSWATRVHYLVGELAEAFAAAGITAVKIRVRPPGRAASRKVGQSVFRARRLTPAVISHLLEAADHVADPGLAEALRRLAGAQGPGAGG